MTMETPCIDAGRRTCGTRAPRAKAGRLLDYADRRLMDLTLRHRTDRETLPQTERTDGEGGVDGTDERD